ncbi:MULTISPECIES: lytic transglycosylase domain-containing protein [Ramlibacter]|uniref:Transglycosylase SLT domain-containing protein n=1 Tax=Ramlibacter pinisoli TaxID=2682844 RepID=A0A6N8J2Y6_9BURK|nr:MULTISPECIES: lytic transglycosylase domain-containing protein [Ramlibacter]MBA2962634.1 lytic transglycosylase domain-containing protein [Ramlibacter sp. CGMCC 1.13660]MVQ32576.1 transglycosylase SLT domain-containing protein [Ramlibacter pinisoli]
MKFRTILALIAVGFAATVAQAQNRGDDTLLEMAQAFRQGNKARLSQLLPLARGHVLEPWAAYWELRARLDTASTQEVQDFLGRYAGTYQEDRLRNDWLLLLGQRRDWTTFADEHPRFRMNDDGQVRCYAALVRHLVEGPAAPPTLADEVRRIWFAQRGDDDACTLAASRFLTETSGRNRMSTADAWRKARLAMEANRPKMVAAAVELASAEAMPLLAELNASPARFLTSRATASSRVRRELIGLALIRMATTDPDNAAALLESKWGPQLKLEERNWIWGVLGRQAAQKLDDDALALYAKVTRDSDLTDDMLAWKARAALRAGRTPQWPTLTAAIDAMSDEARRDPAWQYWKARALLAGGHEAQRAEAQKLLEALASPTRGFYEMLALEELGQRVTPPARPAPPTAEEKEAARQDPSLARGLYAIALGLRGEGVREWNYGTNLARPGGMADRELLAAAQVACEREVWDRCINTSERTKGEVDIEQRFPLPFREQVVRRSLDINLDPAFVYGLIRQESRFVMDARSSVGASGLMQVMPATARWTARKLGLNGFRVEQLADRDTNIAIGTGYLKLVLDDFSNSMALAAAAYNAGPGRPRNWRNGPVMEAAAWAENVPFGETRDYVKKVLANTTLYAAVLTGQPQSLKARLGMVGPRDMALPEPNRDLP